MSRRMLVEGPPLGATLERLTGRGIDHLELDLRVGAPEEEGWMTPGELVVGGRLEDLLARVAGAAACDDPRLDGTYLLEGYAHGLATPALGAYLSERRIPDVGPRAVALRLGEAGEVVGVAFRAPRFGTLAGDAGAASPSALPFADEGELLAWFRRRLVRHLSPLVDALAPRARRGPRALWASVEDTCSGILNWLGEELGCAGWAREQANLLLGVEPPLQGGARFRAIEHPGGCEVIRERNGCCQYFRKDPDGSACLTCARTPEAERIRRLAARA